MALSQLEVLPHLRDGEVKKRLKAAKSKQEYRYWLAIRMMTLAKGRRRSTSRGMTPRDIAYCLGVTVQTVRRIIRAYNDKGPDNFLPQQPRPPKSQRPRLLTSAQESRLRQALVAGSTPDGVKWSAARVKEWLYEVYGLEVHRATAARYMQKLRSSGHAP
jgi:transposase